MLGKGSSENFRFDIQVMRGVAVLAVVFFHAFPTYLPKGFLGVDVFFVISGFLITGHIMRGLEDGRFTFAGFYKRRALRLLPASITTFVVTTLLAMVLLTREEIADYAKQLIGSVTFTANFVIANQTGYFERAAETKPLLHIWSLSLEEQFYFVTPFLLWLAPKRFRLPVLVAGAVLSFLLCWLLVSHDGLFNISTKAAGKIAFFMLPARAWELLAGGICGWAMLRHPRIQVPALVKLFALTGILATLVVGVDPVHPRSDALIVTALTSILLLGEDNWLAKAAPIQTVGKIGDWSYSIYLVHWPLFAFAYAAFAATPPVAVLASLIGVALFLGWAQYTFVEQPFLKRKGDRKLPFALAAATLSLGAVAAPSISAPYSADLRPNVGLSGTCDARAGRWVDSPACRTSARPSIAVWGDSYAMHLVPALTKLPIIQMTKNACVPSVGIAQVQEGYSEAWARDCVAFNNSVLNSLSANRNIKTVVLSSAFGEIVLDQGQRLLIGGHVSDYDPAAVQDAMFWAVKRLRESGKRVIIVGPTPHASFDAGMCNARQIEGKPTLGRHGCDIPLVAVQRDNIQYRAILGAIAAKTSSSLYMPSDVLCDSKVCHTRIGSHLLYRDAGHLTPWGAKLVFRDLANSLAN
jgi:peptidoglycan/LPS O-acetylase OafA/YrhL